MNYDGKERRSMPHKYIIDAELEKIEAKLDHVPCLIKEEIKSHEEKIALILENLQKNNDLLMKKVIIGNGDESIVTTIEKHSISIAGIQSLLESNRTEHLTIIKTLTSLSDKFIPMERDYEDRRKVKIKVWAGVAIFAITTAIGLIYSVNEILTAIQKLGG